MKTLNMVLLCAAALTSAASSATLVTYNFNTAGGGATNATVDVTGGTLTSSGSLFSFFDNQNTSPAYSSRVLQVNPPASTTTLAAAVTNNSYFQFTITGNAGLYQLTSLNLNSGRGGPSLDRGFAIRSSLTGTTNLLQEDTVDSQRNTFTPYSVDLSGNPAFSSISGSVTFFVYIYTPATGSSLEFDDITVSGNLIPEPSSALLGLTGVMACMLRRRR